MSVIACSGCGTRNRVRPVERGVPRCARCHQPLAWVVDADGTESFAREVAASVPVVVDFWAPWCGPCRMIGPVLERLATRHAGHLKIVKVDVDDNPDLAAGFGVQGIPLLVLIGDGEERERLVGALPPAELDAWLRPYLDATAA